MASPSDDKAAEQMNKQQINDTKKQIRGLHDKMADAGDKEPFKYPLDNELILVPANQLLKIQNAISEAQQRLMAKGIEIKNPLKETKTGLKAPAKLAGNQILLQTRIAGLKDAADELDRLLPKYVEKLKEEKKPEDKGKMKETGSGKSAALPPASTSPDSAITRTQAALAALVKPGELKAAMEQGYGDDATVIRQDQPVGGNGVKF